LEFDFISSFDGSTTCIPVPGDRVMVTLNGGYDEVTNRMYQEHTYIYSLNDDTWVRGPDVPDGVSNGALINHGGRVLLVGGKNFIM